MKEDVVLKQKNIEVKEYEALLRLSGGDARKLLNIFELLVNAFPTKKIMSVLMKQKKINGACRF